MATNCTPSHHHQQHLLTIPNDERDLVQIYDRFLGWCSVSIGSPVCHQVLNGAARRPPFQYPTLFRPVSVIVLRN
jgi:hypothetical protein